MTGDTMDLQALVEKSPDADFLRDMIGFAAQRLMELEVGSLTGAAYGEKDVERLAQRNGYRDRPIEGDWPYVRIDATYLKVREAGRIVSVAVTNALGVNSGTRHNGGTNL